MDFKEALETNIEFLHEKMKTNTYEPDPVRRVKIEKPDGGIRLLGVPSVKDRVVQQAIVNIIEPIYTEDGGCQGGVISPLLSNIYLNQFDQKMKSKGLHMVRYTDDILIFTKDKQTAGNYKAYATKILEEELKLKVNETKTKLTSVRKGVTFLSFVIYAKYLVINPKRIKRFKDKIRNITRRNTGRPLEKVMKEINPVLRG